MMGIRSSDDAENHLGSRSVESTAPTNTGGFKVAIQWCVQYLNLFVVCIGYTVATCTSMMAVVGPDCFHRSKMIANPYMIAFGTAQIFLSQIPDFNQLWWHSVVVKVSSFAIETVIEIHNIWTMFEPNGDVAFAYSHSQTLTKIQDKIASPLQNLNKPMLLSVAITALFYMSCGCFSYAFFGDALNLSSQNCLVVIANVNVVVHLLGAYQAYCRPFFVFVENAAMLRFPNSRFVANEIEVAIPGFNVFNLNLFRLVFRTVFVIVMTEISMALPLFDAIVDLLCWSRLWTLTMYFPFGMYIVQKNLSWKF